MKTNLLINIHYLEIGGAETSLIGLLHSLDPEKVNVDLLLNDPRGEMMKYIPKWVNTVPVPKPYNYIERPITEALKNHQFGIAFARLFAKYKFSRYYKKNRPKDESAIFGYVGKYVNPILPSLDHLGEYDVAISYLTPHNIVLEKVRAKKKICWIHTDYTKIDVDSRLELPIWNGYDKIVSISPDVTTSFLKVFPALEKKIVEIENFLPQNLIRQRSLEFEPIDMQANEDSIKLLTIGRYSYQKRLDKIPFIARYLHDQGVIFQWYIIGYGAEKELNALKGSIASLRMENKVILLGKKENPYPYIKACDIYVQPSRYEGKSITVREAQIMGKPVVITDYPTSRSQVSDGIDGFIGPYETDSFANYLTDLILHQQNRLTLIKTKLSQMDYSQKENQEKFTSLLNN